MKVPSQTIGQTQRIGAGARSGRTDRAWTVRVVRQANGAKVMAVRSARTGEMIAVDSVVAIAEKVAAGEISQAAADEALRLLSSPGTGTVSPTADTGAGGEPDPLPELVAAEADADAALATLSDRGR